MTGTSPAPRAGEIVRLRQRLYLVEQSIPAPRGGDATLVRLSCIDDDAQGQPLEALWELELDGQVLKAEDWNALTERGFDPPTRFASYLNTLRWNCVTSTDPNLLQSPFRAGIRLEPYQLEPLRKALRLPRVNLFIADDVGLGKTIEAGLIARELLLRKKVREIVVACPPSMLLQWREELEARFGLRCEILDKEYMQRVRRERGFGVNPWTTHTRFLISQRLLIDPGYYEPLRDWLRGDGGTTCRPGTLLILDEAHHAAPSSGQRYAIDSKITRVVRDIAWLFEHRLFLSATPHNGHSNSFSALLEILDPQRFCRGVKVNRKSLDEVIVRRLKEDLRRVNIGGFPRREVVQVNVDHLPEDAPELRLATLLDEYRQLREQRLATASRRVQSASGLLLTGLQQRLLSSVEAFARTLKVHRNTARRQREAEMRPDTSTLPLDLLANGLEPDDDRATLPEAELQALEEAQIEAATAASATAGTEALFAQEQRLLDEMAEIADRHRAKPDARIGKLIEWIRQHQCPGLGTQPGAPWTHTRVVIFTEYDDTRRYVEERLQLAILDTDDASERIDVYHGPTSPEKREAIKAAFNADPARHPVRILIATDAAREGLNLQAHCAHLFHFDVPWNPGRMEQRNGRIDRKLQPQPVVYCHYFFYVQRPEDRILHVLVEKTKRIRQELGSLSQVVDSHLTTLLKEGLRRDRLQQLEQDMAEAGLDTGKRETIREELEARRDRELRQQVDKLRDLLDQSRKAIHFSEEPFRAALGCALEMTGAPPLQPLNGAPSGPARFGFPALDKAAGSGSSWADTMDSLRAPRPRDQKFWDWRRSSPVRPVVFDDPGVVTDEVVQLHLEQRAVQRLLSRFTAQGFVHHDLSRACLAHTRDSIPRVVLVGRLALYGGGAARLHEEIVPVTARWRHPGIRDGALEPYRREAEGRTMALLDEALQAGAGQPVPPERTRELQESAAQDVRELLPHLETRAEEYAADARARLQQRADAEAKAMRMILEDQRQHLQRTTATYQADTQLLLPGMPEEERRQLKANREYWQSRLTTLERELTTEPDRIRQLYEVQAQRIEPVGLVYLWPIAG